MAEIEPGTARAGLTTGLHGLDDVLRGVMPGDNIVWKVESIADYQALVTPYADAARKSGRRLIYFRFGGHAQLIPDGQAEIHHLEPGQGFETFTTEVHRFIDAAGRGAIYVFDCISDLAATWLSDQMLGNFFMLTCPRLYDLETVTYFAIRRNYHASYALRPITETTQFLLDVFRQNEQLYIRPIKVQHRSSSSMNMIHLWEGENFRPVTNSAIVADLLVASKWPGLRTDSRVGFWRRTFAEAQVIQQDIKAGRCLPERERQMFDRLSRMLLTCDEKMLDLVRRYMTLEDILAVCDRMVGVGFIGGKSVGMLVARAVLRSHGQRFANLMETHDSFFIGSEVFYTFMVRNGMWWFRQKQRDPATFLDGIAEAREKVMAGRFPDYTVEQFQEMLDYFGESPFIVRSSSLLEDAFGNAFAGKYESVFCVNQGPRERRLEAFLDAVRRIYASTLSETALRYRAQRGILQQDEQMGLLVMRVSGDLHGRRYYPQIAGVGFSFNSYCWNEHIDPKAGVLRLVFGLGTRAVDRYDDDYTRIVALNAPRLRPESNFEEVCEYSQRRVDYLDLPANVLRSGYFTDLYSDAGQMPMGLFATRRRLSDHPDDPEVPVLTFEKLLTETRFAKDMRDMLAVLQEAYQNPVDIEFTANFEGPDRYRINLLQCRPLQVKGAELIRLPEVDIREEDRILEAHGPVVGDSRIVDIDRFIYVEASGYGMLPVASRHEVARVIGAVNSACGPAGSMSVMLLGPGRWGTSSPELGIPVRFSEITNVSVLCEIVAMREDLVPDVSLGTHLFNELVEMEVLYMALFPRHPRNLLRREFFHSGPNRLAALVPAHARWADIVKVVDSRDILKPGEAITFLGSSVDQRAVCFYRRAETAAASSL